MAAKGSIAKQRIIEKILQTFPESFLYNDGKEIRINEFEDGNPVQIKITLTAAKVAVTSEKQITKTDDGEINFTYAPTENVINEPSDEEKERLKTLLEKLGI